MNKDELIEELKKLGTLHDSGVLSDEEFNDIKQKLLGPLNQEGQHQYNSKEESNSDYEHKTTTYAKDESSLHSTCNKINDLDNKSEDKNKKSGTSKLLSKKYLIILSCIVVLSCIIVVLYNIVKKQDPVQKIGVRIGHFASQNQIDSLKTFYPDAEYIDSLYLDFSAEKMEIIPYEENGKYNVKFSDSASIVVQVYDDKTFKILSSIGLVAFHPEEKAFAENVGMLKDTYNDIETAKRIAKIPELKNFLYEEYMKQLDNQLTVSKDATFTSSMYTSPDYMAHGYYTVTNNGNKDVQAGDYTLVWDEGSFMFMGDDEGFVTSSKKRTEKGKKTIPAGGSVRCEFAIAGTHDGVVLISATVNKKSPSEFEANYQPLGDEYERFLLAKNNRE